MAFPGTYNFGYYRGDTLEFKIYPKTTAGAPFPLTGYSSTFSIATSRGLATENQITAYSAISSDNTHVVCVITPSDGNQLNAGTPYVYDVEIRNLTSPDYPRVYTLLTGDITVTEQVSDIQEVIVSIPNAVTNLSVTEDPSLTINVTFDAPTSGDAATSFNVYGKAPSLGVTEYVLIDNISTTSYSASTIGGFPVQPATQYDVKVTSVNSAGENTTSFAEGSVTTA